MLRLLTTTCILAILSGAAWADCKSREIKGLYLAYNAGTDGSDFVASVCGLKVSKRGRIASGSSCVSAVTNPILGGRLRLARDCTVTGVIKTAAGDIEIPLASMDRDKATVSGVYLVPAGQGSFTAVKHNNVSGASPSMARYFGE